MNLPTICSDLRRILLLALATSLTAGCASLNLAEAIQTPRFSSIDGRESELRVLLPSAVRPTGGATIRLWTHVENPNAFSLSLIRVAGDLFLGEGQAVAVDFPLGVPLVANGGADVPLDITIGFDDLPGLGRTALTAVTTGTMDFRLDATVGVDAGLLGQPTFGPLQLIAGTLDVSR